MSFAFTEGQTLAIESRGEAVLVSAAAGSGKTRVLTERLMRRVTQEGCDIDSFLVITYTRAAAAELRERIISALGELAAREPENRSLRRQQNLCYRAQIGTIHSFCASVLRENCQSLGLPPSFRVIDDERAGAMRERVLDRVLDEKYETVESNPAFRMLADTVGAGRDDSRLAGVLLSLYEKLLAHPYPEKWALEQADAMELSGAADAAQCPWGREIMEETLRSVSSWGRRMENALDDILTSDEKTAKAYSAGFSEALTSLRSFEAALSGSSWDAAREKSQISFPRLGALRSPEDPELAARVREVREGCKKAAQSWRSTFAEDSAALISGVRLMAPAMRELLKTLLQFHRAFSAEKRRGGWLDFSDLEHMTLELLRERETGAPTPLARELSRRFTEIMVDEYQDVNEVQDLLFSAVSREDKNLFTVGDVKQSIYRFRLADPTIFLRKYDRFSAENGGGRLVLLRENFRSRKSVLDACNHVFSGIMSRELGDVDYDENAALHFGALGFPEGTDAPAVLTLIDPDGSAENKTELEAAYVARSIRKMLDSGAAVYENGVPRPCTADDFAVLLLSPGVSGGAYRRALESEGLSVQTESGEGFFETPEAADLLSLLRVIDNPHDDVTLIAVLRSPCFGFLPDELAEIRASEGGGTFWAALSRRAECDGRCRDFCELLTRLRELAPDLAPEALLWRIYSETDMPAVYGAMPGGADRRANLMRMFEYAASFAASGGTGLYRFTLWLRRLAEKGAAAVSGGGGVKIMSIHKSKGLEFPFVFLADLSHGFNKNDLRAPVLMHPVLGLGPKLTDTRRGIEYPTLARTAISARLERELLSEQMRVLYVAMTRAKERLFMSCMQKGAREALDKLAMLLDGGADYALLSGAQSFSRWLMLSALTDTEGRFIELQIVSPEDGEAETPRAEQACTPPSGMAEKVSARLSFSYPFAWAQELPTKVTATGLKGAEYEPDEAQALSPEPARREFRLPRTDAAAPHTAAARGTAMHAFLQHADLSRLGSRAELLSERDRLAALGRLTRDEAQALDLASLLRFGKGPIPTRLMRADELHREFRFTLLADAADYFDVPRGEELLMQGVVDCFIVENGEITVIDYKTDSVYGEDIAPRARHYAPQVRAYAAALRRIRGLPVREALLVFLKSGTCVSLRDF